MADDSIAHGPEGMSDQEAAIRVIAGEKEAFDPLVRKYAPAVFRHLFVLTRSHTLAEDLCQETFLRAFRFIAQFDPQKPLLSWLLRIASNLAINEWRREARRESRLVQGLRLREEPRTDLIEDPLQGRTLQSLETQELAQVVERAVDRLPEKMRAVVRMRYGQELACNEIGELLGMNLSAVKTTLFRARERLRRNLGTKLKDLHNRWGLP